jgi:hypothetical protein
MIYTYHLLPSVNEQRTFILLHVTPKVMYLDAGEKRFITQKIDSSEKQPIIIHHEIYNAGLPENSLYANVNRKVGAVGARLKKPDGLFFSLALTIYRNPINFIKDFIT